MSSFTSECTVPGDHAQLFTETAPTSARVVNLTHENLYCIRLCQREPQNKGLEDGLTSQSQASGDSRDCSWLGSCDEYRALETMRSLHGQSSIGRWVARSLV